MLKYIEATQKENNMTKENLEKIVVEIYRAVRDGDMERALDLL